MARETTKWPSTRWPITKIMSSDGCNGNRVPLEMGPWYDFREFGCHLGKCRLILCEATVAGSQLWYELLLPLPQLPRSSVKSAMNLALISQYSSKVALLSKPEPLHALTKRGVACFSNMQMLGRQFMKKFLIAATVAGIAMAMPHAASAACGSITIAEMNWASAGFMANVDKIILLEGYGCDAELVPGDTMPTFASMDSRR